MAFYARYWGGTLIKLAKYLRVYLEARRIMKSVLQAPDRWTYQDLAITPPTDTEGDELDLYHATVGGEAALAKQRRDDASRQHMAEAKSKAAA